MRAPDDGAGMSAKEATLEDAVPRDAPGTREIGFSTPERYNASAILYDNLAANGWRPAVTGPAGTRTYAELAADAAAFGAGLLSLGLQRGDRVLLFLDDTPAYPAALFGAIRAGLVPLLINTLTPSDLLQFYLSDSGATVAICGRCFRRQVQCDGLRRHAPRDPRRQQRRGGGCRPRGDTAGRTVARRAAAGAGTRRHAPRRHGVLDVLVGLDGPAEGHRAPAARHGLYAPLLRAPPAGAERARRVLLGAEDLLRLRHGQLHHLPVRGRAHRACCCRASRAPPPSSTASPATSRPCSSACRRSTPR